MSSHILLALLPLVSNTELHAQRSTWVVPSVLARVVSPKTAPEMIKGKGGQILYFHAAPACNVPLRPITMFGRASEESLFWNNSPHAKRETVVAVDKMHGWEAEADKLPLCKSLLHIRLLWLPVQVCH